ncbi:MAG TPA: helix-turn-helix domain-containing protein [Candidatus Limnocylindrales bacterium]
MEKRYLTTSEVASALRVSSDTILRLIDRGELPALRVSERIYRIPVPAFERYERGSVKRRTVVHRQVPDVADYGAGEEIGEPEGRLAGRA